MYCLIESEGGYSLVDVNTGEEVQFIVSQKEAVECLDILNNIQLLTQEQKKSWLDSLIH